MDVVIHRFGTYEFSPFRSRVPADDAPQSLLDRLSGTASQVPWIRRLAGFAQSGTLQAIVLALSVAWVAFRLVRRRPLTLDFKPKASAIRWEYELPSQVARAAALAFVAVAYVQHRAHWLNVVLLAYVVVLGLARLINDVRWRHVALHQVNLVTAAMLAALLASQFLPCIQVDRHCAKDASVIGGAASLAAAAVVALLTPREWVPPQIGYDIPGFELPKEPAPEETCSCINYCTYGWLTPIIWKGTRGRLDMSGIPRLPWYDEPLYLLRKVQAARSISKTTFWTTLRFQRVELLLMSLWISTGYIVENVAPYGMFNLLAYLDSPNDAVYRPWLWLLLMFSGPVSRSLLFQQYIFTSTRLVVRIKCAMTQELYHRALESMELEEDPFESNGEKPKSEQDGDKTQKSTSAGRLANLMAADVDAIFRARDMVIVLVGVPSGTIISLIGLYRMLGWASIVGTAILVLATPISVWLGKLMFNTQKRVRKAQDARISMVTEYLASIRAIKYFAWEGPITDKIVAARAVEQKGLWGIAVLQAVINEVTQIFPYLALLVMFGIHVGLDKKPLEASTAFTTVYLVKNIRRNVIMASASSRTFAGALVAFGRLDKYFESTVPLTKYPVGPLRIAGGYFRRNKKATFRLEDVNLDFVEGGLNVVTGQSGSGKSTLLLAILGETYLEAGSVTAPADVAFASQSSWLQNETIRNNILFGSPMEQARYDRVMTACCLAEDLRELPERDQTVVGENGTSLSGGQKARVALARALYSKAPLLLLDDVFSALDAKTSAGVWKHCFCGHLLHGRTTILVTQVPWISSQADLAILLDKGQVQSAEPNIGIVRRPIRIAEVLGGDDDDETETETETETPPEPGLQENGDAMNDATKVAQDVPLRDVVDQEMKATRNVGRLAVFQYMGYFGHPLFAISCLVGLFLSNVFYFSASFWLSIWVEAYNQRAHVDIAFYMGIFALFTFSELISYGLVIIMFEWGTWRAARTLHNDFIRAIMQVPLSWFKAIPIGRITNRFSGDMSSIDGSLNPMLRATIDTFMVLCFRIGAVSAIMPIFMFPGILTCFVGVTIGEMYTRTAVVIKRLASSAQSPVFSQFADTLAGLPIIRARKGMAQAFGIELANKLRVLSAASKANYNCNRWVAVRIDFFTALVALLAGIIAVSQVGLVGAGLVGFSLTNANDLSQTILVLVRAMNELEVEMQSFHRVKEYVKLEPEEKDDKPYPDEGEDEYADDETKVIPKNWPRSGEIEFRNVTIRYDTDGPDILTDVNLKFKAGERVAVVGRTGSGKSTLVLSLLRFTDIVSGQIFFDGVDITKVPRRRLRESLTIIPQEAVLFNGSVESNLDPTGRVPHEKLESALENCKGIASFSGDVTEVDDGTDDDATETAPAQSRAQAIMLSTEVDARGENFSHGQRQVLSLCRALIRKSKLMLLDEATASMDYETDRGIQQVLRNELEAMGDGRTLVTIAHRLRTIIDYDRVVVMSAGRVVENGSPKELYDAKGRFYDMVCHSGEEHELRELLEEK